MIVFMIVFGSAFLGASGASATPDATAWETLIRESPHRIASLSGAERDLLAKMSFGEFIRLVNGASDADVRMLNGDSLKEFLERRGLSTFDMDWYSIDGGLEISAGGSFRLMGSFGQPDTFASSGGEFRLEGGFLGRSAASSDEGIFQDGFETGNTERWSSATN